MRYACLWEAGAPGLMVLLLPCKNCWWRQNGVTGKRRKRRAWGASIEPAPWICGCAACLADNLGQDDLTFGGTWTAFRFWGYTLCPASWHLPSPSSYSCLLDVPGERYWYSPTCALWCLLLMQDFNNTALCGLKAITFLAEMGNLRLIWNLSHY